VVPGPISPGQARSVYWSTSIAILTARSRGPQGCYLALGKEDRLTVAVSTGSLARVGPDAVGRYPPVTFASEVHCRVQGDIA